MPLIHVNRFSLKRRRVLNRHALWAILVAVVYICGLAGCSDVNNVSAPPAGPGPLTITTTSLPDGTVNQPYAAALGGSGGITPYTWSLAVGSPALPTGLSLDAAAGTITGTPTDPGTTTPIFRLEDSSSPEQAVQKPLTITIATVPQPLTITTTSLPDGVVNQPYPTTTMAATGGIQPYAWSVNPALPNGLQFNVVGTISGKPLSGTAGTTTHTFTASDSDPPSNQTATTQLSLKVNPAPTPLAITFPDDNSLPNARVGKNYNQTLKGSGGILPYTWSITPALPAGLLLNTSTGAITGKPASGTDGIYFLTITLQDSSPPTNQSTSKLVTLIVRHP